MSASALLQQVAASPPVRRAVDAFFARYARHQVNRLDYLSAAAVQRHTLLSLVSRARGTRFGRQHGFSHIRTVQQYQQRVPLRYYEDFWKDYWQPAFPFLGDATWPGHIPYLALSSGTTSGSTKYIPISREMLASNRHAAMMTLAFFVAAHPDARLFAGQFFFLGGSTALKQWTAASHVIAECDMQNAKSRIGEQGSGVRSRPAKTELEVQNGPPRSVVLAGDLSGIAAREIADILRPYTFPPLDLALLSDWDRKMQLLAEESAHLPITAISGVPSWLLVLFQQLQKVTGKEQLADIWPNLQLVIHGGTSFAPYRSLFRRIIGNDRVHFLETYPASEGFIAIEDPHFALLRLLPDHGIFFEFVPIEELRKDRPTRHTLADVVPQVQYAVVVTTCAGLWSYVLGDTICFERRKPPLLRFTGRTKYFLSAFGEHLISEEVEKAVAAAAEATGSAVVDFHVGPVFPARSGQPGRHRYLIEFAEKPPDLKRFTAELDAALCRFNEDYQAHRQGDLTMLAPEVCPIPQGGFSAWMRSRGQLGGQHKVPRMDNNGEITAELSRWFWGTGPVTPGCKAKL